MIFLSRRYWQCALFVLYLGCLTPFAGTADAKSYEPFAHGKAQQTAQLDTLSLEVLTYRPSCPIAGFLFVFHGMERDAQTYRDDAIPLADRLCRIIIAPRFDQAHFSNNAYQRGGLLLKGQLQPASSWTISLVPQLIAWARASEQAPDLPYEFLGHSAGAQFLDRLVAYLPTEAQRIVIADPSSWVWPTLETNVPYGFGALNDPAQARQHLIAYLGAPITVVLGQEDTKSGHLLDNDEAREQGANRVERGQNVYKAAQLAAQQLHCPFAWHLQEVPHIGHSDRKIFASQEVLQALSASNK